MPELPSPMSHATITAYRAFLSAVSAPAKAAILSDPSLTHIERIIPGPGGPLTISILRPKNEEPLSAAGSEQHQNSPVLLPGIVHFHGGGMTSGSRFLCLDMIVSYVKLLPAIAVSVEYRLAPEHPHPAPVEDCYAALAWTGAHASELGIDATRLLVAGESAGGGLAAGVALLARDRGGPGLCAQLLVCPMLDDRSESVSSRQYADGGTWSREQNLFGWRCLLGEAMAGGDEVSCYAAPARANDLSGLPQAFIDVGSAELFRDEDVAYALKLWECGVQAELHVWPGGIHSFHSFLPDAALSKIANATRLDWVRRVLKEKANIDGSEATSKI
ncbi:alpha/beta hydrolase fold-3 domain-containing protein [Macrophomina phaseolina]|uniref:Alpha/beta hydrolase fold-3 domain-containing protein n=1 Tax=Macrophomina phaseolina TaxID=35725 RepID=A0ABQ8FQ50_9PEZI|nr:alpha/beta hydrolase fold-3 domain-containing protein [Macrophomina phaseolina]